MSKALQVFALTFLEAARDLPATGARVTFRDLLDEYNAKVTPEETLTWTQFRSKLRDATAEGHINVETENLKDDRPVWKTLQRSSLGPSISKLRKAVGADFLDDVNQQMFDAMIRHQIYLLRLSGSVRNATMDLLDKSQKDIEKQLKAKLGKYKGLETPAAVRKLQWMDDYIRTVRKGTWNNISGQWVRDFSELAKNEQSTMAGMVQTVSPTALALNLVDTRTLTHIATHNPFEGRTLKEWARAQADADVARLLNAVRIGMVQGEGIDQIVSRVRGAAGMTNAQVQAIVRTAVNSIGNEARAEFIDANAELWSGERFVATLDSRTTPVCRANDGKIFEVGKGPKPPLHFNCRSLRVPTLSGEALGERPMRGHTEKGLLRDFARENDLDPVSSRDKLPFGYKSKFDAFSRQQIRAMTSRVPSATSYQSWLETQSRSFQDDVLGPTRAKLFRSGKLSLDKFVDRNGNELTLKDLASKHADAFKAAGLNPEDFL
jgi:SPP1 gp7 family putative phage head morphogenesis protein